MYQEDNLRTCKQEGLPEKHHQQVDTDQISVMDEINNTLSSLAQEENKIAAIPTWPWQPDQIRLLVSSILLPIIL